MRANIQHITKTLKCTEAHALDVERYMDEGAMIDWSEASARMISTLARAVSDHLRRGESVKVVEHNMPKPKAAKKPVGNGPAKKASKAPAKGSKAAQALSIYKRYEGCTRQEMITYLVSEMASLHGIELTRPQAAGLYQSAKKKA
jgi:hypothetical protein